MQSSTIFVASSSLGYPPKACEAVAPAARILAVTRGGAGHPQLCVIFHACVVEAGTLYLTRLPSLKPHRSYGMIKPHRPELARSRQWCKHCAPHASASSLSVLAACRPSRCFTWKLRIPPMKSMCSLSARSEGTSFDDACEAWLGGEHVLLVHLSHGAVDQVRHPP